MDKTELRRKMDELCRGWGESCNGCPSQDLPVCSRDESELAAEDYEDALSLLAAADKAE